MPEPIELLPADQRALILTEVADVEPLTNVMLLKQWKARQISGRMMCLLLGLQAELAEARAELEAIRTADLAAPSTAWLEGRNG